MERSRSHGNYIFGDERTSAADLAGVRGHHQRGPGRSANLHGGLDGSPLSAGRSPTPSSDFLLSPHVPNGMQSPAGASPAPSAGHRERREKIRAQWRLRNQNPFYDHSQFRQYRTRQEQKEEKDGQKWPPILEDPFLDALLLIPDMGRSKYFMHGSLYGRNMIISTYVWMAYCKALPARATPNAVNKRDRKAISSHIQVLKNFFKEHRFFHFFFPTKDEEQRRGTKDDGKSVESQCLKTNPVLVALSAGRFPDVRPNYEYFAHLLEQNSTVSVRPKTCCVFVSSPDAHIGEAKIEAHTGHSMSIPRYYSHPKAGGEGLGMAHSPDADLSLHEYTNSVSQTYSGPVKEITKHWETSFPELCDSLNLPEPQDEDSLTILEMNVTLELHKEHFPSGSELNGLVEMAIAQPSLQSHQWKCVTRLVRPRELCAEPGGEDTILELTDEVDVQFNHQAGCGGDAEEGGGCHCMAKPRHDIRVPFPAAEWAGILTNCASYAESQPQQARRRRGSGVKLESDDEFGSPEPTQGELLAQIGMFQELWSCEYSPPHPSSFSSSPPSSRPLHGDGGAWTRRAVVFWKFRDVHQYSAKKKKWVAEAPTTHWRFLTVNDPTSEYHMRNAYVSREPAEGVNPALGGGAFVSPRAFEEHHQQQHQQPQQPQQHQHLHHAAAAAAAAAPSENFLAWNMNTSVPNHMRSLSAPTGSFHLADMSGILPELPGSSYPSSLESSSHAADLGGHFGGGLLQSSCTTSTEESRDDGSFAEDAAPPATDLFADSLAMVSGGLMYDAECCDPALQTWETDLKSWAPAPEFDASLPPSSDGSTPEWGGAAREFWAAGGEGGWAPPLHMSLRPEWDEVKDEGGLLASSCGTAGMGDAGMADMGMGKTVLGKRGREVEAERPARRVRRELRVVGRA